MSPGGQSNLLLIRRLLHLSTPGFDPIRGRFFAQVLPNFSSTAPITRCSRSSAVSGCTFLSKSSSLATVPIHPAALANSLAAPFNADADGAPSRLFQINFSMQSGCIALHIA